MIGDERDLASVYERWLGDDYDVRLAHDGEAALDALDHSVDVVVLDRIMSGLSGGEVLERIHERRYGCRVAIVSAVDPGFDVIEMGFDDYPTKPIDGEQLHHVVEMFLRRDDYTDRMPE